MKRSISSHLVGLMLVLVLVGMYTKTNAETDALLVLRGHVKSVEIDEYDPHIAAFIRIRIEAEFVNTGAESLILLKREPLFVAAALAKTQKDAELGNVLADDAVYPARSWDSEWMALRASLDKSRPPTDEIRILKPKESWTTETTVGVTVPIDPQKYTSSRKKERLDVLQSLSPLWLRVTCLLWPENIEGLGRNRDQLPFGHKLQKRWKTDGVLWLDDMRSEPMALDLKTATYKPKAPPQNLATPLPKRDEVATTETTVRQTQNIFALTDAELVTAFQSNDAEKSYAAVREILRRSDTMIPLLLQCKGNKKPFYGYGLGDRNSAFLSPLPTGNAKRDKGRIITVEVAALYMISAIFYYDLEFAQAPYLADDTPIKEHRFNTAERVSAAWQTVDAWYERVKTNGIATLRSHKDSPLRSGKVRFWGECPECPNERLGSRGRGLVARN